MHSLKLRITLLALLVLVALVAASSQQDDGSLSHHGRIYGRQEDEDTASDEPTKTEVPETTADGTATDAEETERPTGTETNADEETGTTTKTKSDEEDDKRTTEKPKPTSVDPREPVGGIEMLTPGRFDPVTYIKIGENATFGWNYTNLIISPTAIDVIAYCSRNDHSYTITGNMSMEETGSVVWDTAAQETQNPNLLTEMYTLIIHDSDVDPSEAPKPGHLGTNIRPTFGVYRPQPYEDDGNVCATCSGAGSARLGRQALVFMFGMVTITICSFTWVASGLGLF